MNSLLIAFVLAIAAAETNRAQKPQASGEEAYWDTVNQYARGDKTSALHTIGQWTREDLEAVVDPISGLAKAARKCGSCAARGSFDALPLTAAVLLHSERDRIDRMFRNARNERPDCRVELHGELSERLLKLSALQPQSAEFIGPFSEGLAAHYQAGLCFIHARYAAEAGLRLKPQLPALLLSRGRATEALGTIGYLLAVTTTDLDLQGPVDLTDKKKSLRLAREDFALALALNPQLGEAHLRLGRVLWSTGRFSEARSALTQALGKTEGDLRYLAHLFFGRVLEDTDDLQGATLHYTLACSRQPTAQTSAMALAHALSARGQADQAREVLERVLPYAGRRQILDPFWDYPVGSPAAAEAMLEKLRREQAR